ncbi:MAG TPA: AAA family ATPase [Planctomycetota bacterium]|nr:AAA family ATPase [Planctomycetota bacterium]
MSDGFTLVVLAGLPGTGKSTLAERLAEALDAPVFSKDRVRAALFDPRHVRYERAQDDFVVECLVAAAAHTAEHGPACHAVLDGRTFQRAGQLDALRAQLAVRGLAERTIELVADADIARARLAAQRAHPAADRGPELYDALAAQAAPLPGPKLVLDSGVLAPDELARRALEWLRAELRA